MNILLPMRNVPHTSRRVCMLEVSLMGLSHMVVPSDKILILKNEYVGGKRVHSLRRIRTLRLQFSLTGLAAGARVDMARTFGGDEILPLLCETRPTILLMLPAALFALVRDHHAKPEDFHSLGYGSSGGDKVSAELEREFSQVAGLPIHEGYGRTELCPITNNPALGLNKFGSVGSVAYSGLISLRDESGLDEVQPGVEGRPWAKSPCKMVGYWENPAATSRPYGIRRFYI